MNTGSNKSASIGYASESQHETYGNDEVSKAMEPESNILQMRSEGMSSPRPYSGEGISGSDMETPRECVNEVAMDSPSSLREINISPLSSGFVVTVGCQRVAVESIETLLSNLTDYLTNPKMYERKWNSTKGVNKLQKN